MNRRRFLLATGSGVSFSLAGCISGSGEPAGDHDVGMTQVGFRPDQLTVEPGTTVEFRNTSSHTHTVTSYQDAYPDGADYWASGGFDSQDEAVEAWASSNRGGKIEPNDSYEHTFEIPGSYNYYCIPHEDAGMAGQVLVEE